MGINQSINVDDERRM